MVLGRCIWLIVLLSHASLVVWAAPGLSKADLDRVEQTLEDELDVASRDGTIFLNEWAVQIPGGQRVADIVARDLGYENIGQIGSLDNHYLLKKSDHPSRSKRSAEHHSRSLKNDDRVAWVEQQHSVKREKRDFIDKRQEERAYRTVRHTDRAWDNQWYLQNVRVKRSVDRLDRDAKAYSNVMNVYNDELFTHQWYFFPSIGNSDGYDKRSPGSTLFRRDHGVIPQWANGITGKGVVVTVIDDGLEFKHKDLFDNYSPEASIDLNDGHADPTPRYDKRKTNKHGTRCAGEIAMIADNGICGVGVAYNAKIGGIRILDGTVTDALEAKAFGHANDKVHVMSSSWGPQDNGAKCEGPGHLATQALEQGALKGRGGKGILYMWASGNGGANGDSCAADGYAGSIDTISINSVDQKLHAPWYSEPCPSTLACTYSSGEMGQGKITSTDINGGCTTEHTGTSASAPLAAGIVALLLEARPDVTARGVQHLIVWTAEYTPLAENDGWQKNAAGFYYHQHFGFGLINANNLIKAAVSKDFKPVPEKSICVVDTKEENKDSFPVDIASGETIELKIDTTGCAGQDNEVKYLEHVQLYTTLTYTNRGQVEIWLTSPSGTKTQLMKNRMRDNSAEGYRNWPFMSVHTWGEEPAGKWTVIITANKHGNDAGQLEELTLVLHGTKEQPAHVVKAGGARNYPNITDEDEERDNTENKKADKKEKKTNKKKNKNKNKKKNNKRH